MRIIEKELIKIIHQEKAITAKELSKKLEVSLRSIKNYVHDINKQHPGIIMSSHKGYSVNPEMVTKILTSQISFIPQTAKERITYIENRLINNEYTGTLNIYDLCDEIFVSYSTLKKDISVIKEEMLKYDLDLITKGDEIEVIGPEKGKRQMLSAIIYKESGINFVNLQSIQSLFPNIDITFIRSTIIEVLDQAKYFTNDYNLFNLLLHITIALDRMQHGNTNCSKPESLPITVDKEYELSCTIAKKLEDKFHIHYTESEIQYMVFLILSRATAINYTDITVSNLHMVIGEKCMDIVEKISNEICDIYYIDLENSDFIIRFALHIKSLLVRCKNNYYSKNPFTREIKTTCPLIYDMALHAASLLENKLNITINDDEIAYIALHLGCALEEQKSIHSKITAVLYCPNYYDMSLKMADRINHFFSERLLITNVINEESEIAQLNNTDLVISTIPISGTISTHFICIPYFYTQKEEQRLSNLISELEHKKRQNKFEHYLRQLIVPELLEVNNKLPTHLEAIHYMVKKFQQLGYVNDDFENEILEREQLSSTAFGNFAIPHSMKMNSLKTGINIIISDTPIIWNDHPVQLILMMCFNKTERRIFSEIYEPLTMILGEAENVRAIISCRSYEEFISKIVSMI